MKASSSVIISQEHSINRDHGSPHLYNNDHLQGLEAKVQKRLPVSLHLKEAMQVANNLTNFIQL